MSDNSSRKEIEAAVTLPPANFEVTLEVRVTAVGVIPPEGYAGSTVQESRRIPLPRIEDAIEVMQQLKNLAEDTSETIQWLQDKGFISSDPDVIREFIERSVEITFFLSISR